MAKLSNKVSEPSILVKPISRFGGLDNIHIALIALSIILILLLVVVSFNTKITVVNATQGTNSTSIHNASQAMSYAERVLAGFSTVNNSASVLPFLSNISRANVSYLSNTKQWLVSIPYRTPLDANTFILNIEMQDSNLSKFTTFVQLAGSTPKVTQNYVVSPGAIKLAGQTSCGTAATQLYWFIDLYAPGSIPSLVNATNMQSKYGNKINVTIKTLFTPYSQSVSDGYGLNNTLSLSKYILCGSVQDNFSGFVRSLNASYSGTYMPTYILQGIAEKSGFNMSAMSSCVASSQRVLNAQALQAKYYNITSSAAVLVDCQYMAIPQTAPAAACYANKALC